MTTVMRREPRVRREQDDSDDDHRQALDGELGQPVLEQLLEVLDVARHPRHDDTGLLGGEVVERQALQVGEDLDAQVVHDPSGEPAGDLHLAPLGERGDEHRDEVQAGDDRDDPEVLVMRRHALVDGDLRQLRAGLGDDADDDDEHRGEDEHPGVLGEEAPEGEPSLVAGLRSLAEADVRVAVVRLVGQEPVDAGLQLRRDPAERQAGAGCARSGAAAHRWSEPAATHAPGHQPSPSTRPRSTRPDPLSPPVPLSPPAPLSSTAPSSSPARPASSAWASTAA